MSTSSQGIANSAPAVSPLLLKKHSLLNDCAQLFKLRVTSLVMMTAWAGFYMGAAKSGISSLSWALFRAIVGIGLTSAGAAALNEVMEHRLDARMARTRNRPIPAKRLELSTGLAAGLLTTLAGVVYLALTTNVLTGILAFFTAASYLGLYTPLKQRSPISTFIGAFPGAMPPLLGWTAVRGTLEIESLVLFLIVFVWQFPHFQAIAWLYREDYEAAGVKMLPVVDSGGAKVVRQMLAYSSVLLPVSLLPTGFHMAGKVYLAGALALGVGFLWFVFRLALVKLPPTEPASKKFARHLLRASVIYLPLLFALMMINVLRS